MFIAGVFRFAGCERSLDALKADASLMAGALKHRGLEPRIIVEQPVCFVFHRGEPACGDHVVVHCGQFFNSEELKMELSLPHDALIEAILVAAYEKWGSGCPGHIAGEFTFVLFDKRCHKLFIARDRVGLKPLYYSYDAAGIMFSSEVNALIQAKNERQVNYQALHSAIVLHTVCSKEHLIMGVYELRPGHCLTFQAGFEKPEIKQYWDRVFNIVNRPQLEYEDGFKRLLVEAVKKRLPEPCVKVGIASSGGIDSTLVAALVRKNYKGPLATYTMISKGDAGSEYEHARLVAEKLHTEHHEIFVSTSEAIQNIPRIIWHMGEFTFCYQFMNICLQTYFVGKAAKENGCGHIFTGNGVEHNLDGNGPQRRLYKVFHDSNKWPKIIRDGLAPFLLPPILKEALERRGLRPWSTQEARNIEEKYIMFNSPRPWGREAYLKNSYMENMRKKLGPNQAKGILAEYLNACNAEDYFNKLLYIDFKTWNSRRNFVTNERLFGAFGVQLEIPFLDADLVEFSSSMPIKVKHSFNDPKYFIRKIYNDGEFLPVSIFKKGKKDSVPQFDYWEKDTLDVMRYFVSQFKKRAIFQENFIGSLLKPGKQRDRWSAYLIFGFFVLELWFRIFVDSQDIKDEDLTLDHLSRISS